MKLIAKMRHFVWLSALLSLPLFFDACKATLQIGGPYDSGRTNKVAQAADLTFYQIDAVFATAYKSLDGLFQWEKDNRAELFKLKPELKHGLDLIRPKAVEARNKYLAARKAYLANPGQQGLSNLQTALDEMNRLSTAGKAFIPR